MELALWQNGLAVQRTAAGLARMNERIQGHGLTLSEAELHQLALRHAEVLRATGRVEFGEGVLPKLLFAFCDSPYITPTEYAATLQALCELFYHFKNETREQVSDDELVAFMKQHFDGDAHGSLDYLGGTLLERLAETTRFGPMAAEAESDEEDDGQDDAF